MKPILCFIFFLSGASALIFEALWFQLAGLTFGNSVWAASIVLASFMGGLALGNGIAAFHGNKIRYPLRLYAILEFVIGISGLTIVIIFPHLSKILAPLFFLFAEHAFVLNFFRAVIAIALLIVPSTAMGFTLPVLVKVLYIKKSNFGEILGALYGWNTFGAVAGVLLCELVFVKWFGINGAAMVAVGFNFLAAIIALLLFANTKNIKAHTTAEGQFPIRSKMSIKVAGILLASGFTGFVFLALEVVWFRFILLFYNAFSWNFATILASVLAGISLGSIFISQIYKVKADIHRYITVVFQLIAILVILLYCNFDWVFSFTGRFNDEILKVAIAALFLVVPVAFISGMIFTMLGKALHSEINAATNITGMITLANTTGGMLGALAGGYFFIPVLGIENAFIVLACLYSITALLVTGTGASTIARGKISYYRIINCVTFSFFVLTLIFFPFGLMNRLYSNHPIVEFNSLGEKRLVLKEGLTETIQYLQKEIAEKPLYQRLVTNAHSMSSTHFADKRYMSVFVYLPVFLNPDPKDALLVCFGCGTTAKSLTDTKSFKNIEIVDISKDIFEMSRYVYPAPEDNPVNDPRVKTHIEDGRFFLLTTDRKYDVITAEPPPPKYNGVVNLYSQEYFQLIYDCLNAGGIVTYWLPVELATAEENKSILKGFCNVFQNCSLWTGAGYQWIMMGIKEPVRTSDNQGFINQWRDPVVVKAMRSVGIFTPEQMSSLFIADSKTIKGWTADSLPLTDNYPQRLATSFSIKMDEKDVLSYNNLMNPAASHARFIKSDQIRKIWPDNLIDGTERHFAERGILDEILRTNIPDYKILHQCIANPLLENYIPWVFGSDDLAQQIVSDLFIKHKKQGATNFSYNDDPAHLIAYFILKKDYLSAEKYLQRTYNVNRTPMKDYYLMRIYLLYMGGNKERAVSVGEEYINYVQVGREKRRAKIEKLWADIDMFAKP